MNKVGWSLLALAACTAAETPNATPSGKADASAEATFYTFSFEGTVVSPFRNDTQVITNQIMYTMGQLNGHRGVGRLDKLELSAIKSKSKDGNYEVTYQAKLPVALASDPNLTEFELILPADLTAFGIDAFVEKYGHACVDASAHDVTANNFWYYYRPDRCAIDAGDAVRLVAKVSPSGTQTSGKYPEYDKVWEDKRLEVVALFGKYKDGATDAGDAGIAAYNQYFAAAYERLEDFGRLTVTPANAPFEPGVAFPEIVLESTARDGRVVRVLMMLTDNVRSGLEEPSFRAKYEAASSRADLIGYNGHAGLGANMRAIARAGKWLAGQYLIMFENGCDTYAYIDGALAKAHAQVNGDADPQGTKYLDEIANAMPAAFAHMADAMDAIVGGLMRYDAPQTYEDILANIASRQVVLVTGEEDNTYQP